MKVLRSFGSYDYKEASRAAAKDASGPSRTQQQFKDECDINTIVRRFGITGQLPFNTRPPLPDEHEYAYVEYQDMLNFISSADRSFSSLPADVRTRFQNNPGLFLKFVDDPANHAEGVKLGIFAPPPDAPPSPVPAA